MLEKQKNEIAYLKTLVSPEIVAQMERVLAYRTQYATVVLEDIYQSHNASAVLRSCEIFGTQDIHAVEHHNPFIPANDISMGAAKWLTLHRHTSIENACSRLKNDGYTIYATTFSPKAISLYELPLDSKIAVIFGNERRGVSQKAHELADGYTVIPMFGFTQSFNISVSVALCLQSLITRLHASSIDWRLSQAEQERLLLAWMRKKLGIPENAKIDHNNG